MPVMYTILITNLYDNYDMSQSESKPPVCLFNILV